MKTLFCTDGSKISFSSLENFINWVKTTDFDVLSVADLGVFPNNNSLEASQFAQYCTKSVEDILINTEKFFAENGLKLLNKIKKCGSVSDSILETESENDYSIILLGSNGKRGIQKWLGSVSNEVASNSKTSVYISKQKNKCQNVLFAIDNTQECYESIQTSLQMLNLSDKKIYLVTVYEMPDYVFLEGKFDNNWQDAIEKQQKKSANNLLNKFEALFNDLNISVHSKTILKGIPASEILKFSKDTDIDLVICGMRKPKSLPRFVLSSVSRRLLENIASDMLIVKPSNN